MRVVGTGFWVEVGNGQLVWGQAGRSTPAGGEGHRVRELGKVVSCGGSGEKGWRTELDLSRRKSLDDHHRAATVGTEPERSGFLGEFAWRYRNRITAERTLPLRSYHLTPYIRAEVYYDSNFHKWSRTAESVGSDVLQLSRLLAGDVKESRNDSPTRDLQMAADRTRPHSAAMLADSLAGENPARGTCPVATVVISGDGAGD